jgi:hypothetical protein
VTDEGAVTHDDYSLTGEPRSTGGQHHRPFPFELPEKVVPAYPVESMKDSTGLVLAAIQIQAAVQKSFGSLSSALSFNWLTQHSVCSMSSRTLPKYFACMSFPSGPGWQ